MAVKEPPPCGLLIPAELEEHIQERAPEFLARTVESAAKQGFAVEYKGRPVRQDMECYNCEYCHRLRYLKGEWYCRITKPHDPHADPCACFVHRGDRPSCLECANWCQQDPRCMEPRSQWAGQTTSHDNYCRFFDRRMPEK